MRLLALTALISLITEYGFYVSSKILAWLHYLDYFIITVFILELLIKIFFQGKDPRFWRLHAVQIFLIFLFGLEFLFLKQAIHFSPVVTFLHAVNVVSLAKIYIILVQIYLILLLIIRSLQGRHAIPFFKIKPEYLLIISYVTIIVIGALLLMLPRSQAHTGGVCFLDSLFTATSAVCVTGLITVDTATVWSPIGKFFILILLQIGGLGIMTYTAAFSLLLGKGLSMKETLMMQDMLSVEFLGKIGRFLITIIVITFLTEFLGTIFLFIFWHNELGAIKALWFSIFHSVSAFCNAGFSLFSNNLMECRTNSGAILSIASLIVLGGLGFSVLVEIFDPHQWIQSHNRGKGRFSLQTRVVIWFSLILILTGAIWIYFFESSQIRTYQCHGVRDAIFQSITSRTAGFNTVDISGYSLPTQLLMMILMVIGASPGSTGGGIKTVTVALIFIAIRSAWNGRQHVEVGNRKIPDTTVRNAFLVVIIYLAIAGVFALGLTVTEDASFEVILFEELSAMGTVGLSLGLTPHLSCAGKWIIIISMLIGRIGLLTFLLIIGRHAMGNKYSYPEENVMLT